MKNYNKIRKSILRILNSQLPHKLYYHGIHHTLNALKISKLYIKHENVSKEDAKLLRLAILFHDIGFTVSYKVHEKESVVIAERMLHEFNFNKKHIQIIKGMILSTKIPQTPKTKLERIICDIDLDYLGSSKYYKISIQLFNELNEFSNKLNTSEWNKVQLQFLKNHKYHTDFALKNRQPNKNKIIETLISL